MNRKEKLSVLSVLIIIILILMTRQSLVMRKEIKNIKPPTAQSRQFGNMSVYKWITVRDLAIKHNLKVDDIFKALQIKPEKDDENIPIGELAKKYNKTPEQMRENLKKIIPKRKKSIEGKKYE